MSNLPKPGEIFDDKYEIQEFIGSGGIGTVYRALQLDCRRTVALKILQQHAALDQEYRARFIREAQVLSKLQHHNIVSVYSLGVEPAGLPYLVMEYLNGESVRAVLNSTKKISVVRSLTIIENAARSLAYVHAQDIIHRDLKPENILLTHLPEPDTVKLVDFGLAWLKNPRDQKLTSTGELIGTSRYMSPEQCKGKPVDFRTDIYSLSACLYEMMVGKAPFDADTAVGLMYKQINEFPPAIKAEEVDRFDPALNILVQQGMAKDPQNRFASMDEMADEIKKTLSRLPSARLTRTTGLPHLIVLGLAAISILSASLFFWIQNQKKGSQQQPETVITSTNLKGKGVEKFYRNSIAIMEKTFGPYHPKVAEQIDKLAEFYGSQGRDAELEPLLTRVLEISDRQPNPDKVATASRLMKLASLKTAKREYRAAELLIVRALKIEDDLGFGSHEGGLGPVRLSFALEELANCKSAQGRYLEAEPFYRRALETLEFWDNSFEGVGSARLRRKSADPAVRAVYLIALAENYRRQGKFAEAEPLYKRAQAMRKESQPPARLMEAPAR